MGFDEVYPKICRFCAYRDRSIKEVLLKTKSLGVSENMAEEIVQKLILERFLDESRFVESYVSGKKNIKKWGKAKIKNGLIQAGVQMELVNAALSEIEDEDYETQIIKLVKKKMENMPKLDARTKIIRFLIGKGYELDKSMRVVDRLMKEKM